MNATTTTTNKGQERIARKVGTRTFSVRENQWGNWYGYLGAKRVEQFFGPDQRAAALAWLDEQAQAYTSMAGTPVAMVHTRCSRATDDDAPMEVAQVRSTDDGVVWIDWSCTRCAVSVSLRSAR